MLEDNAPEDRKSEFRIQTNRQKRIVLEIEAPRSTDVLDYSVEGFDRLVDITEQQFDSFQSRLMTTQDYCRHNGQYRDQNEQRNYSTCKSLDTPMEVGY